MKLRVLCVGEFTSSAQSTFQNAKHEPLGGLGPLQKSRSTPGI